MLQNKPSAWPVETCIFNYKQKISSGVKETLTHTEFKVICDTKQTEAAHGTDTELHPLFIYLFYLIPSFFHMLGDFSQLFPEPRLEV